MTSRLTITRRALMLSASFPLAALSGIQPAAAEQVVTVAAPTTATVVNTDIATKIATPDRDLKIVVTSAGTVANPGSPIVLIPAAGQGDGTVTFSNAGLIGAIDNKTGLITDAVGVVLNGAGKGVADNKLIGSNANLITGGFSGTNFGGTVDFANTGAIYGNIFLSV